MGGEIGIAGDKAAKDLSRSTQNIIAQAQRQALADDDVVRGWSLDEPFRVEDGRAAC